MRQKIQLKWKKAEQKTDVPERGMVTRIQADESQGLSSQQVQEYVQNGWVNRPVDPPTKTIGEIIKGNLFTYFNLVFAVLAVLLMIAGSFRNMTFLVVVAANLCIGIVQEIRAKKVLDKLSVLHAPRALVVRGGERKEIAAEELVLDDIVIVRAGNQICADAIVTSGEVSVNESLLTGEADEVQKRPGEMLMSGSYVVSGECFARIERVGADSYISKLTLEAKAMDTREQSEILRILNRLVGVVGILIVPIGVMLFVQQYVFLGSSFSDSIVSMVAAVIGMIPEGLYLLTSVALAVSVIRLASRRVLVHDMKCIETLARVDVLCVDKTGTITENNMQVTEVIPLRRSQSSEEETGGAADVADTAGAAGTAEGNGAEAELSGLLGDFAGAMSDDNITMRALKRFFRQRAGRRAVQVIPFSPAYKYSGVVFDEGAYVLGAPEFVLREEYGRYKEQIEGYGAKGSRVVLLAAYDGVPDGKELTQKAEPLALILLSNPIRRQAPETFRYFADQGVQIKVISGDNPVTVSQVAQQAGINGAENYIDAASLHTDEELRRAADKYTVFGRVTPEQKRKLVQALKKGGHTVGMTGDGVNDILALKDADCSVAMASGSDAAAQASQLVLLNSDFACMPAVVLEGRRVVNNIERSASLFLVKNIFSFLMAIFSVCFQIHYPLEPVQVSLISTFTIGIPAFFLALQPNRNIIQGNFLSNVLVKALPAGITDFIVVGALVVFGQTFGVDASDISTACTMLLAIVGFMILYSVCRPMNALRWCIWGGSVAGLLLSSIFFSDLFALEGMSTKCVMLFVVFAIVTEPVLRYSTLLIEKIFDSFRKICYGRGKRRGRGRLRLRKRNRYL